MRIEQIMNNNLKSLFFVILIVWMNASYSLQDSVVAIVNDRVILQSDLDERMKEINIETSKNASPSLHRLTTSATGKARSAIRRYWQDKSTEQLKKSEKK